MRWKGSGCGDFVMSLFCLPLCDSFIVQHFFKLCQIRLVLLQDLRGFHFHIHIDCTGVEDELDVTMAQRSELDYLIYNNPLGYADLILNGEPEEYLKNVAGSHGLED